MSYEFKEIARAVFDLLGLDLTGVKGFDLHVEAGKPVEIEIRRVLKTVDKTVTTDKRYELKEIVESKPMTEKERAAIRSQWYQAMMERGLVGKNGVRQIESMTPAEVAFLKMAESEVQKTVEYKTTPPLPQVGVDQWVWSGDGVPTGWAAAAPQVVTLADGRIGVTVDLPGMPAQTVLQEGVDYTTFSATLTLPEGCVCPDCNGTGEYRGLTAVEPCRTCRKAVQ